MPNEVKLLPCPFCRQELEVVESWAKAFDPPRLYREYHHHVPSCVLGRLDWTFPDLAEERRQAFIAAWNHRPTTVVTDEVVERVALIVGDKLGGHEGLGEVYRRNGDVRWKQSLEIARAAIEAMPTVVTGEQPGWQPIESAPRDGSAIILAVRGRHPRRPNANGMFVTVGRWLWSPDARLPHDEYPDDGGFLELNNDWGDGWGGNIGDRFWRPLPEPPAQPGDA